MKNLEKIFTGLVLGFTFPLLLTFSCGILWFSVDKNENHVAIYLIAGLLIGLIINYLFLKSWINKRYELSLWFIAGIYIFYNIMIYGFMMGFPVINLGMGLVAGYYYGNRLNFKKISEDKQKEEVKYVSVFTGFIMTLICISTALLALGEKSIESEIQHMLGLEFEITRAMIWGIILIGGTILIISQVLLTKFIIHFTLKIP